MKKFVMAGLVICLFLGACAVTGTGGSLSKEATGYLRLTGDFDRREILVDGKNVGVDPEEDYVRVSLKPGNHLLEVRSSNRVLLTQQVEITPGQTVQITINPH